MGQQSNDIEPRPQNFDVDPHGAYLTALRDKHGGDVLLPRQITPEGKTRGGSHVCLPNFGPGGATKLAQHGFGRQLDWNVVEAGNTHCVLRMPETAAPGSRSGYETLQATIRYTYSQGATDEQLMVRLNVRNSAQQGSEPMPIAPGFHPYFVAYDEAVLDNRRLSLEHLGGTKFIDGPTHVLETTKHQIVIHSNQLQRVAVWSGNDTERDYVCVEPTQSGPSFAESKTEVMHMLSPGEQRDYEMVISWRRLD